MHTMTRLGKRTRLVLSWLLAVTLALGGWPAPALQELLGPQVALAAEDAEDVTTADDQEVAVEEMEPQEDAVPAVEQDDAEAQDAEAVTDEEEVAPAAPEVADAVVDETAADDVTPAEEPSLPAKADGDSGDEGEGGQGGPRYVHWTGAEPGSTIFSDEDLTVTLERDADYPEGDDYKLYVNAGCWEGEPDFANALPEGEAYTYDEATGIVTLHGQWLCDHDCDHVDLFATVAYEPEGREDEWDLAGGDLIHFRVRAGNDYHARVWLEEDNDSDRIYTGDTRTFTVHTDNLDAAVADGQQLYVYVGNWFGAPDFTTAFPEGEAYTYDPATGTIVLDGTWSDLLDYDHVDVFALIAPAPTDSGAPVWEESIAWDVRNLEVRESREEYNDRVRDDTMVRGWEWTVFRWYGVEYDTAEHPDNEENHPFSYEVIDVQVVEWSDEGVVTVRREEWVNDDGTHDWNWRYRAEKYGWAKLQVTYLDVHGDAQSYDFTIWVNADRYQVDLWTEDGSDRALPSATVTLHANAFHESEHDFDPSEDRYDYQWGFEGNGDIATIRGFGDTATVTFHDCWEGIWENTRPVVRVYLLDENGNRITDDEGNEIVVAERSINLFVCDDYHELWPCEIDSRLAIGQPLTITPEVRHYQGDGYTVIPGVTFRWENVDESRLSINDNGDGTLTIMRLDAEDTDFRIIGSWRAENGDIWEKPGWFHLDKLDYGLWFEDGDYTRAYSDDNSGAVTLTPASDDLDALLADGYSLDWSVGVADDHGNFLYDNVASGDDPVFRFDGTKLVLIGEKMAANEAIEEHGGANVRVRLMSGGVEINDAWCWVELRQRREEYEFEHDCSLLPGWDRTVNRWYHLELDTAEHPEDEEDHPDDYEVVDVQVAEQRRWDDDAQDMVPFPYVDDPDNDSYDLNIVTLEKETWKDGEGNDDWNWRYRARNFGDATLTVTYRDAHGDEQSYDFKVFVGGDVYSVDLWNDSASNQALPGSQMTLHAHGWHDYLDFDDDGNYSQQRTEEGFTYDWRIEDGSEFASIAVDQNDPTTCVVTFNERPDGQDWYEGHVRVAVRLMVDPNPDDPSDDGERAFNDLDLNVRDDYLELVLDGYDSQLDLGKPTTITPHLDHYAIDGTAETIPVSRYEWSYDENAIKLDDNGDGTYTIERLKTWGTDLHLAAFWDQDDHEERIDWGYWFDNKDYDLFFTCGDDTELYNDWKTTLELDGDALDVPGYDIEWQLGVADGQGGFVAELPQSAYTTDGTNITLDGPAVGAFADTHNHGGVNVCARVSYKGEELVDAWCWVSLRNACTEHDWSEKVLAEPGCETPGSKRLDCANCHEQRVVEVPALGHSLTTVAGTPATLESTGIKAHWRCERCNELFADAAGTQKATAESLTTPRLINIGTAAISGLTAKTYTGKALTPAPVVKIGGTTLKAGTDYTVSYKNNVNAGKATVTLTGKGAYGGTKTATFVINKAASTLTAAPKAKEVKLAKVKKKAQKVKGAVVVSAATGKVTFAFDKSVKKAKKTKKFKISSTGVITVPKKTKKGTYKLKVVVTCAGDANHTPTTKTVAVKIKVK